MLSRGQTIGLVAPPSDLAKAMAMTLSIGEKEYPLVEIRSTGDVILDVTFKNTSDCVKAIPKDALRDLRTKKLPIPSPRILYRVRLETLKKHSEYFRVLLTPPFAEGVAVQNTLSRLIETNVNPTEVEADKLPRVRIVDEDTATKTVGRESIFSDLMQIIHGSVSQ